MQRRRNLLKCFLYPHIVILILLVIISILSLIYSFCYENAISIIQYFSYFISAYTLLIVCLRVPKIVKKINLYRKVNPYIVKYQSEVKFRLKTSLYVNIIVNLLFAFFHLFAGIFYKSIWHYSLLVYYVLLTIMRVFLLADYSKELDEDKIKQWKRYGFCGVMLIIMNIALSIIVFYIVRMNKGFSYNYIFTIAMAFFTFTITTLAIVNFIRYKKYNQPLITAIKFVGLVSAIVSMLSLETAMITVFGGDNGEGFRRVMTAISGGVVCVGILAIGVFMVINSTLKLKKLQKNQ